MYPTPLQIFHGREGQSHGILVSYISERLGKVGSSFEVGNFRLDRLCSFVGSALGYVGI